MRYTSDWETQHNNKIFQKNTLFHIFADFGILFEWIEQLSSLWKKVHTQEHFNRSMTKWTKLPVRRAMTQISLGIRLVWSASSLSAWRNLGLLATQWAHSEDADQIGRMPRLIWVFAGRTGHFVGFVMLLLKYLL